MQDSEREDRQRGDSTDRLGERGWPISIAFKLETIKLSLLKLWNAGFSGFAPPSDGEDE